jgi:hypothetical protein
MTRREVVPPPDIRIARGDVTFERKTITDAGGKVTGTVEGYRVCTRLERMHKRGELNEHEYKAGSRFAEDCGKAEAATRSCLNRDTGGDPIDAIILNGARMNAADIRLRSAVMAIGPVMADVVLWVAFKGRPASEWAELQGMARRAGKELLGLALRKLATHYGLEEG